MKIIITESQYNSIISEAYKIGKDERLVLSDTENFLQVVPLTQLASCKYGSNTKWCVSGRDGEKNIFTFYKDRGWDVSMVMIKKPEIQEIFKTKKFAFNIYNNSLEIHKDDGRYMVMEIKKYAEEAGVYNEVKSLIEDYVKYIYENYGHEISKRALEFIMP